MISVTVITQLLEWRSMKVCSIAQLLWWPAMISRTACVCVSMCAMCESACVSRAHVCESLCVALSIVCMCSLTQDSGIDYTDMSQHALALTHSLCLRLYEGNNGQPLFPRV